MSGSYGRPDGEVRGRRPVRQRVPRGGAEPLAVRRGGDAGRRDRRPGHEPRRQRRRGHRLRAGRARPAAPGAGPDPVRRPRTTCARRGPRCARTGRPRSTGSRPVRPSARTRPSTASGRRCRRCATCSSSTTAGSHGRSSADAHGVPPVGPRVATSSRTRTSWASTRRRRRRSPTWSPRRRERDDALTAFLASATPDELARQTTPPDDQGWPPGTGTVAACLRVVLDEEWAHHGFCVRDLDRLDAGDGPAVSSSR